MLQCSLLLSSRCHTYGVPIAIFTGATEPHPTSPPSLSLAFPIVGSRKSPYLGDREVEIHLCMVPSVGAIQSPLASVTIDDIRRTLGELLPTLSLSNTIYGCGFL